jgi:hypothetical protein
VRAPAARSPLIDALLIVPARVTGIHVFMRLAISKTWMAGTSPVMTIV